VLGFDLSDTQIASDTISVQVQRFSDERVDPRSETMIKGLNPQVRPYARELVRKAALSGIQIKIIGGFRTYKEQKILYCQGRNEAYCNGYYKSGNIVTNAKAGQSFHNWRVAFDFCPIVNGKCQWNDKGLFATCGAIAESVGLEWAGRWTGKFKETAHCQYTGGLSLLDFQKGKTL
jgi:peptidoglycan L-alanyl-D-glutamate endopeptidase CwlK